MGKIAGLSANASIAEKGQDGAVTGYCRARASRLSIPSTTPLVWCGPRRKMIWNRVLNQQRPRENQVLKAIERNGRIRIYVALSPSEMAPSQDPDCTVGHVPNL
jgi:hypothetical protein